MNSDYVSIGKCADGERRVYSLTPDTTYHVSCDGFVLPCDRVGATHPTFDAQILHHEKDTPGREELMLRAALTSVPKVNGKLTKDVDHFVCDGDVYVFAEQGYEITFFKHNKLARVLQALVTAGHTIRCRSKNGRTWSLSRNRLSGRYDLRNTEKKNAEEATAGKLVLSSVSFKSCFHRGETYGVRWLETPSRPSNKKKQPRSSTVKAA